MFLILQTSSPSLEALAGHPNWRTSLVMMSLLYVTKDSTALSLDSMSPVEVDGLNLFTSSEWKLTICEEMYREA